MNQSDIDKIDAEWEWIAVTKDHAARTINRRKKKNWTLVEKRENRDNPRFVDMQFQKINYLKLKGIDQPVIGAYG